VLLATSSWGASDDGRQTLRVWDVKGAKMLREFSGPSDGPLAFSPDGRLLAQGSRSPGLERGRPIVILHDTGTGKEVRRLHDAGHAVNAVAFSPGGRLLATGGYRSTQGASFGVKLWDVATGKKVRVFHGDNGGERPNVQTLAFSPDGKLLASAGTDGVVCVWDAAPGKERHR